jgi:hypothetical protein
MPMLRTSLGTDTSAPVQRDLDALTKQTFDVRVICGGSNAVAPGVALRRQSHGASANLARSGPFGGCRP